MKKRHLTKWLIALGIGVTVATGLTAPIKSKAYYPGNWVETDEGWMYELDFGNGNTVYMAGRVINCGSSLYYLDDYGIMQTGWIKRTTTDGKVIWYYANSYGELMTGWQVIGGCDYYFYSDGKLAVDTVVELKYVVDENGVYIGHAGEWKLDGTGWWYQYLDGTYPKNEIVFIGQDRYAFDANGYMKTGWYKVAEEGYPDAWYYADTDGRLMKGWQLINGEWYYFNSSGLMVTNSEVNGKYWLGEDGTISKTVGVWEHDGVGWKFLHTTGVATNKVQTKYLTNTSYRIDGDTYYFDENGYMKTGMFDRSYLNANAKKPYWVYRYEDGSYPTRGWHQIDGEWYFFNANGEIATNTAVEGYALGENGKIEYVINSDGQWKQDEKGWRFWFRDVEFIIGSCLVNGKYYYFAGDGYMLTGWVDQARHKQEGNPKEPIWSYYEEDGRAAVGWKQIGGNWYFFYINGVMAHDVYIDGYYIGHDGVWTDTPQHVDYYY